MDNTLDLCSSYWSIFLKICLNSTEESNDHLTDEDKSPDMLKKEIKQGLDEISKREEVFIVIIDAINQVTMCPLSDTLH